MRKMALIWILMTFVPLMGNDLSVTIEGEVVSVQKFNYVNKPAPYAQFLLHTPQEDYMVEAGPAWFLEYRGITLLPGEHMTVEGSLLPIEGQKMIRARTLHHNGQQTLLEQ